MTIIVLAALGLILGSFVNALVWRLHAQDEVREELAALDDGKGKKPKSDKKARELKAKLRKLSMSKGRSMCSKCGHELAPKDLVPLFSWLSLRGKCRYCHKPIEDSPFVEAILPLLFIISYVFWPADLSGYGLLSFGLWLVFLTGFAALSAYDIRWFLLPDRIVWPLVGLAALQVLLHATVFDGGLDVLWTAAWGVAIASGVFLILYIIAERLGKEWIGFGDVKLGLALGLLVGGPLEAILLLYIASLAGLLVSLPLMARHRLKRSSLIPFGPFLMLACIIVTLAGPALKGWIEQLFLINALMLY
jgi:prepilin signal peptidase PulO-like enzyme (type II secretory pathway)